MSFELWLALGVGAIVGVLAALLIDNMTLVRRIQEANGEKQQARTALQKAHIQQQSLVQQVQLARTDLESAVAERTQHEEIIARQLQEIEASRDQLQTTIKTTEALKENAQEAQERLEELDGLHIAAQEQLETAVTENSQLATELQLLEGEVSLLEEKTEKLTQDLAKSAGDVADLEQKMITFEAQMAAVESEKDAAIAELEQAEQSAVEQNAHLATLQQRLVEMDLLRDKLVAAEANLETADSRLAKLQIKMDDVQTKMNYSGKNQLQLIRGIGPTYASRLNEFGIQTFADLADCDPEQVASIIKKRNWQSVNIQHWLDEAKALAASLNSNE